MARQYFGTDGIRGKANTAPMTAEIALKVAMATAKVLNRGDHRHRVVIGKDTRLSGYMLEPALVSGFISMGMDVVLVGPIPTPAIAMLTRSLRADLGVMISASHNPFYDNGIKLFGADGYKLSDEIELEIESLIDQDMTPYLANSEDLGRAKRLDDASGRYVEFVKNTFPKGATLDGLKIVIDCAHGAAYKVAQEILYELGATVIPIGVQPDGRNINKSCGATSPAVLQETVIQHGADLGIALDGDADRIFMCDEQGKVIDGDQIMGVIATALHDRGQLAGDTVVATVMSNLGLERYLKNYGMRLERTGVGDRYVVERMREHGFNFGGEQSGHIVLGDANTTGDGLIAALQILSVIIEDKRPVSEICHAFDPVPQILRNMRYSKPISITEGGVYQAIKEAEEMIKDQGRILVRKSGTEPLIRVMAEGDDTNLVDKAIAHICDAITAEDEGQQKAV